MAVSRPNWIGPLAFLVGAALIAAAWKWTPLRTWADPDPLVEWLAPYRSSWLAIPLSIAVFVVAELFLFPVLVLIFVCGLAFGPWLGPVCALSGALASAIPPFLLGRKLGRQRLERYGGTLVRKLTRSLDRRGVVAIFLVRKIPAPFTLVNLVCGASPVSLRDFLLGTLLGMGTGTVLLTLAAGQLGEILRDPEPGNVGLAVALILAPAVVALLVQRILNRRVGTS
jgi:phospholipase D1/2